MNNFLVCIGIWVFICRDIVIVWIVKMMNEGHFSQSGIVESSDLCTRMKRKCDGSDYPSMEGTNSLYDARICEILREKGKCRQLCIAFLYDPVTFQLHYKSTSLQINIKILPLCLQTLGINNTF